MTQTASNAITHIRQAKGLIEIGMCTGHLGEALDGTYLYIIDPVEGGEYEEGKDILLCDKPRAVCMAGALLISARVKSYDEMNTNLAFRAVTQAILNARLPMTWPDSRTKAFEIIYTFNDSSRTQEAVLSMFDSAIQLLEEGKITDENA